MFRIVLNGVVWCGMGWGGVGLGVVYGEDTIKMPARCSRYTIIHSTEHYHYYDFPNAGLLNANISLQN